MKISVTGYIGDDTAVTVNAYYAPYYPEQREPPTPAEPAEIVIESVCIGDDDIIEALNEDTLEMLEEYCWDYLEDKAEMER